MWVLTLVACLDATLPARNCETRVAWYPDADGDGLGEPTDVYLGCQGPDGWTTALAPAHTGDTGAPPGDTAPPADTGAPSEGHTAAPGTGHTGRGGSGT
jgi:hypothetical protein